MTPTCCTTKYDFIIVAFLHVAKNKMQDALEERLAKYARATGHPRLVELLARYTSDQDKVSLSDGEEKVCILTV